MILNDFCTPPNQYGEVSFFWWHGDDITKEKLSWILEQLKEKHICGLQINYCHGDKGGRLCGLTMESNPKPFSDAWWELVGWFIRECRKYGMSVSLSDYTLGSPGQGFYVDEVLKKHPEYLGQRIVKKDGEIIIETVPYSLNPMVPGVGQAVVDEFYGAFERHFPGECGKGINFFFSDELNFNIRGNLWCETFPEEFVKRKGYRIEEKLEALFEDIGEETVKIRLDYYDVIVQLSEEAYFKPVYDWHESRGMIFGCDHGGRGRDVTEFGDYFRAMKWYQGPGNDQPHLASDIIKSKVSSSIAHLYKRPRVWLEGFYSSGWQTSAADVADGVFRNYGLGHNLLSLHGLYYSTHGSMWEWAPPCNHHHMPYWGEMGTLLACTKRLSYALSQGVHRCDVAVVYPVAAVEADPKQGKMSVEKAFQTARLLYKNGIDFDFIDFESIERADIANDKLCVSQEEYRYIILPEMKNVRYGMYRKLADFSRSGKVIVLGCYPSGSDAGNEVLEPLSNVTQRLKDTAFFCEQEHEAVEYIKNQGDLDITFEAGQPFFHHRVIQMTDVYYLYGVPKDTECTFRAVGIPVVYNPWDGKRYRITEYRREGKYTHLNMPVSAKEVLLVAFEKECRETEELPAFITEYDSTLEMDGVWECEIIPTMDNQYGDYRLPPGNYKIGPEARAAEYSFADRLEDIQEWKEELFTFSPQFFVCRNHQELEEAFIAMKEPGENFEPYSFSMKEGVKGDAGYQGSYHGLKGKISDDFLVMGDRRVIMGGSSSVYSGEGVWYFFTTVFADREYSEVIMDTGELKPDGVWINHEQTDSETCRLRKGTNTILLKYSQSGRTHFVLRKAYTFQQTQPLVTNWYGNTDVFLFDPLPSNEGKNCWYRFWAPPGAVSMKMVTVGETAVFIEGQEIPKVKDVYLLPKGNGFAREVIVRIVQQRGYYACAAFREPVTFETMNGKIHVPVDQKKNGLGFYSGGLKLKKKMELSVNGNTQLHIGFENDTARVIVNGKEAGIIVADPYTCDISQYVQDGENEIEVYLFNSLHNHMKTIPTNFNFEKSPRGSLPFSIF